MKRMLAAICAALMLAVPALADTVVFENLHYGAEAYEMHLNNETNTIVFNGETYSLDDDAVSFKEAFSVYGGKTRAVYEMTLPQSAYSVEDDGKTLTIGELTINVPYRTQLWVAQGNRISGEYEIEGPIELTDVYREDICLPRDDHGRPLLIDRIYFYRYQADGETHCSAATLYIDYEGYSASHAGEAYISANQILPDVPSTTSAPTVEPEPTATVSPERTAESERNTPVRRQQGAVTIAAYAATAALIIVGCVCLVLYISHMHKQKSDAAKQTGANDAQRETADDGAKNDE